MQHRQSRRQFLTITAAAAAASCVHSELPAAPSKSANEKLNIACVGVNRRAAADIAACASQNIAGICDIDDNYLAAAAQRYPTAEKFNDFRKMLDKLEQQIDAVVVGTPDHIHAPASAMAMRMGKHCYCEKPLTHTVHEARVLAQIAAENKLVTQMGTQIHAGENYRRVVEIIQAGVIGDVREVHVWVGKGWGGGDRPKETPPVPANIHWDLWLGPAPERPYHPTYLPAAWRRWWDFGGGTLGDMGCHYIDLP
ncbi:MAG: Gfo/Idh/MocA family oxidoreductase, partial [Planctomycetales bacterium]|nr:Gfo/Idh/MocA family oxidoreductase [Planctomycetales bacterium]